MTNKNTLLVLFAHTPCLLCPGAHKALVSGHRQAHLAEKSLNPALIIQPLFSPQLLAVSLAVVPQLKIRSKARCFDDLCEAPCTAFTGTRE